MLSITKHNAEGVKVFEVHCRKFCLLKDIQCYETYGT
jgi:hypothetical protein